MPPEVHPRQIQGGIVEIVLGAKCAGKLTGGQYFVSSALEKYETFSKAH